MKDFEEFLYNLGYLSEETARVKLDANGNIEYIRIDDRKFTNPEKMADQIIRYTEKIREARDKAREWKKLSDLPEHIPDDIVRYHPSWIKLRENAGYLNDVKEVGEIFCMKKEDKEKTYQAWISDIFLALGIKEYYPPKIPNDEISIKEFNEYIRPQDSKDRTFNLNEGLHPDCLAFYQATEIKKEIDNNKDLNLTGIRYRLEENSHFPIIAAGTNKRRHNFDLRRPFAYQKFIEYVSKKNPSNAELKQQVKQFKKIRGFY